VNLNKSIISLGIVTLIWLVVQRSEKFQLNILIIFPQSPPEIGELIGIPNAGRLVHRLVHNFPKLQYALFRGAKLSPLTPEQTPSSSATHNAKPTPSRPVDNA
jgi:hypothetical protein